MHCKRWLIVAACVVAWSCAGLAQIPTPVTVDTTILQVDVENWVNYINDVSDPSKLARASGPLTAAVPTNFATGVAFADVTAINGSPAKGVMVLRTQSVLLNPNPNPGQAIADVIRGGYSQFSFEFLKPDGSPVGSVFGVGTSGGTPPPGSPLGATIGNNAIVGGTGPFIGARGALNNVQGSPRITSQAEDPSLRRTNAGGQARFLLQIIPMFRPQIGATSSGPAIAHSSDFSPVTASKPAAAGEILSLFATGLGPTQPGVDPGKPFPVSPSAVVNGPIDVTVNGKSTEVLGAVGLPGAVNGYQVNFRVPADAAKGPATIQVNAAWITGPPVSIPIQ